MAHPAEMSTNPRREANVSRSLTMRTPSLFYRRCRIMKPLRGQCSRHYHSLFPWRCQFAGGFLQGQTERKWRKNLTDGPKCGLLEGRNEEEGQVMERFALARELVLQAGAALRESRLR